MLSKEENDFILYWERNRLRQKKLFRQFLVGIPIGLLFVIPTVISFTSGWYKRADMEANSADFNPMVLFVALLLIVGFTAIFYQRWKWDQYEQRYRELIAKRDRDAATRPAEPVAEAPDLPDLGAKDAAAEPGKVTGKDEGTDAGLRSSEAKK
jgi:hypothetical protein